MAYKKIDREFCLTDDSVNVYGYRLLTNGLLLEKFTPTIGFLMHKREDGIAVMWEDFRYDVGKLFAKPVVNESQFPNLAQQIEDGFYSAASVGHIVAIEMTDDPTYKLEGQTGPTVTKWFPRECSIVDIPGNYNAIAKLYDESDTLLRDLTDSINTGTDLPNKQESMEKPMLSIADLDLPNLSAESSVDEARVALKDLVAKANRVDAVEKELSDLKAVQITREVNDIITKGLADKKLTKSVADNLKNTFANNPEGLKSLVDAMPVQMLVSDKLDSSDIPNYLQGKTFNDLYVSGQLEEVKRNYPDLYAKLKTESHG